jgi:hypothetical protein
MKQTFEEYYRDVVAEAERFAETEEMHKREDHLRSFNLGRMAERFQHSKYAVRLRVTWLLAGLAIGIACGRLFPDRIYRSVAGQFIGQSSTITERADRTRAR